MRFDTLEIGCGSVNDLAFDVKSDIRPLPHVTYVADMKSLPMIADHSIALIKIAAAIEHITPAEQVQAVQEWHRILIPYGIVLVTTPDLDWIERERQSMIEEKRAWAEVLMRGGQKDEYDVHRGLLNQDGLIALFVKNGYRALTIKSGADAAGSLDGAFEAV